MHFYLFSELPSVIQTQNSVEKKIQIYTHLNLNQMLLTNMGKKYFKCTKTCKKLSVHMHCVDHQH